MKTLKVPSQNISHYGTLPERVNYLNEAGAEAIINEVNWKDVYSKLLPVSVRVAHDGQKIYLLYTVKGEKLRAVNTEDYGSVWEDSCVEFFMQKDGDERYRNFECNVLGALLAADHEDRNTSERLTEHMPDIIRFSNIQHRYEGGQQVSDWTMYLEIPKKAMGYGDEETLRGKKIRANFYKCGDETPEPHYISWNPIDLPKPDFHVPQFFGLLELE